MLGLSIFTGQVSVNALIAALQPVPWQPADKQQGADAPAKKKRPLRDHSADVDIPSVDPITHALLRMIF